MHTKNLFIVLFSFLLFSCENNDPVIDADNLLLGFWIDPTYNAETTTFKRGSDLPNDAGGISFAINGDFIERSSGWCGTPPLSFIDYMGSFELEGTLIKITSGLYPSSFQWRIVSISENELVVKRELSEQETEHRNLMSLFDEIQNIAYSVTCNDATNWAFVAYGSKACGGYQGYIPYSTNIDTNSFFTKIAAYTKAENEFNIKWGIISDCSIIGEPKGVECINGYPNLIY